MNYNKLYYFYIITQSRNLYEAADRLCVSQPALSKTIRDLEDEFHVTLFEHAGRSLKLTAAGEVLRRECSGIFGKEPLLISHMKEAASSETVTLRFGYMLFKELFYLVPAIRHFNSVSRTAKVLSTPYMERADLNQDLLSRRIDIALKLFTQEEILPELDYRIIEETHLALVTKADHPLAGRSSVNLSDLKYEKFIFLGTDERSSEYRFARNWCIQCGFEPDILLSFDWIGAVLMMVQSGLGISILSDLAPLKQMTGLALIPLENAPTVYSALFWRADDNRKALYDFLDFYTHNDIIVRQ